MPINLFLSHISEEARLASQLKTSLEDLFSDDVEVFTSSNVESIQTGTNWLKAVQEALHKAAGVIVLCSKTSVQRSWVQFELGGAWMLNRTIIPVCHSGLKLRDLPIPLALLEGAEISEEGLARLYNAVAHKVGTRRKPSDDDMARHLGLLRAAESSTVSPTLQFERFIDVILPAPGRLESDRIPGDAVVESNDESFKLFGFITGPRTWREIETAARKTPDQRWISELQNCIFLASRGETFRPVQAIYHNHLGSYQPQLSKKEFMSNGACRFHVHFVETVVAPLTEVQNEFGLMATLLRLGLRFRYEVIQKYHRAFMLAARSKTSPTPDAADGLRTKLRNAIVVIENDALSRGAEHIDRCAVIDLFNRDDDQQLIAEVQDDWDRSRARLFEDNPPPNMEEMQDILNCMRELNVNFMSLGSQRFHEMVDEHWRTVPPRSNHASVPA